MALLHAVLWVVGPALARGSISRRPARRHLALRRDLALQASHARLRSASGTRIDLCAQAGAGGLDGWPCMHARLGGARSEGLAHAHVGLENRHVYVERMQG
eukprot:351483-Chlamydomonas_euryale.AAC.3